MFYFNSMILGRVSNNSNRVVYYTVPISIGFGGSGWQKQETGCVCREVRKQVLFKNKKAGNTIFIMRIDYQLAILLH